VGLLQRFSIIVPKDWRKTPIQNHPEAVERRSNDPENLRVRKWIDMADIAFRANYEEDDAA